MNNSINSLKTFFQDEMMMRTPLIKYTVKDFISVLSISKNIMDENKCDEAIKEIDNFLPQNRESILSLYILTLLKAYKDYDYELLLEKLLHQFISIKKSGILIFIAKSILDYKESMVALNVLSNHYTKENNDEDLLDTWERILKQDKNNYALPLKVATIKTKMGENFEAIRYIKMSFFRALEAKDSSELLIIWKKLVQINSDDFDFFMQFSKKMINLYDTDKKIIIYKNLFDTYYKDYKNNTDQCLIVLKEIIALDPENPSHRTTVTELFKEKYKNHTHLEEFLNHSGLQKKWKSLLPQIETFEKHIRFDNDTFVFHKSFGYGIITNILKGSSKGTDIINMTKICIDFETKKDHQMTLRIALNSLIICDKNNIRCLSAFSPEKLKPLIEAADEACATAILKTYNKPITLKDIKTLFIPNNITEENWPIFWKKLKNSFLNNPHFEYKNKLYDFNTKGGSYEDDLFSQFNKTKDISIKISIVDSFTVNYQEKGIENLEKMIATLCELSKEKNNINYHAAIFAALYYTINHIKIKIPINLDKEFRTFLSGEDFATGYDIIKSSTQKNIYIDSIIKVEPEKFPIILKSIFLTPSIPGKSYILDILSRKKSLTEIKDILKTLQENRNTYLDHYLLFIKANFINDPANSMLEQENTFIYLLQLLDKTHKETSLGTSASHARRQYNNVLNLLFDTGALFNYLRSDNSKNGRKKIFTLLNNFHFLENYLKIEIKELITKLGE